MSKGILVIEDDQEIREVLQYALEIDGYSVISKTNGREALDFLETSPLPGLILLDLTMPVMNGSEFVEKMKQCEVKREIPIVVLTAGRNKPRPKGVTDFLTKPIDLDILLAIAERYCGTPDPDKTPAPERN